jgi:hypothetical protein
MPAEVAESAGDRRGRELSRMGADFKTGLF